MEVQAKLLEKGDKLSLDEALDIARTFEATKSHVVQMQTRPVSVHTVQARERKPSQQALAYTLYKHAKENQVNKRWRTHCTSERKPSQQARSNVQQKCQRC